MDRGNPIIMWLVSDAVIKAVKGHIFSVGGKVKNSQYMVDVLRSIPPGLPPGYATARTQLMCKIRSPIEGCIVSLGIALISDVGTFSLCRYPFMEVKNIFKVIN